MGRREEEAWCEAQAPVPPVLEEAWCEAEVSVLPASGEAWYEAEASVLPASGEALDEAEASIPLALVVALHVGVALSQGVLPQREDRLPPYVATHTAEYRYPLWPALRGRFQADRPYLTALLAMQPTRGQD
jgi:hypothetical protein